MFAAGFAHHLPDETAIAHGSARWATRRDLRRHRLVGNDEGLILGRTPGLLSSLLRIQTEGHLLTIAPTRAGKGVSAIIPNLLTYPGSAIVIDPKGENARATAAARAAMGHTVHVLDPWDITGLPAASYNPLLALKPDSPDFAEDAMLIADALVHGKAGLDPFWEAEAKALLTGLVLHVVTNEPPHLRTLPRLRELLTTDPAQFEALLAHMAESKAASGLVARAAYRMRQKPDKERASVISAAQSHTHFLDSPRMARTLAGSDFDLADLKRGPTTIYLVLPSNRLHSHARWLRLMLNLTIASLSEKTGRAARPVLFLLDEFAALGRLDMVEVAIGLLAGYGVQLWPIVQDVAQLRALYGERWTSFIANAAVVQAFAVNDPATAELLSRMLGTRTAAAKSTSRSRPHAEGGTNINSVARPLLYPAEIRALPKTDELLFIAGCPPIRAGRVVYYHDRLFRQNQGGGYAATRPIAPAL